MIKQRRGKGLIVIDAMSFEPLRCWKCGESKRQDEFKDVKLHVRKVRGRLVRMFFPTCYECRTDRSKKWGSNPLYNYKVEEFFRRVTPRWASGGINRGLLFLITYEDNIELFLQQDGRCALSGIKMMVEEGCEGAKNFYAASLDRIDSKGDYEIGNVQLVCAGVNIMKNEMPENQFVKFCAMVVKHHAEKQDELEARISS